MSFSHPMDALLAEVLPPGSLYAVGGRVRDDVRLALDVSRDDTGRASEDLDYVVVGVASDAVHAALDRIGRVDVTGATFAVFKLTRHGQTVDVALPRRERSTGPEHRSFAIQSGPDVTLVEDLERRDFRMNALARAVPSGELIDPFGGCADIEAHRIDLIRPNAFEEDPLRMLRGAQFAARFGFTLTPTTLAAMGTAAPLVTTLSAERVREEFVKLLTLAARPSEGFALLQTTGVLAFVWPELLEGLGVEQNDWHAYDVWTHNLATLDAAPRGDLVLRLAALLHDVAKPRSKDGAHFYRHEQVGADLAHAMLAKLRFSNAEIQTVEHLVRQHMYVADPMLGAAALRRFLRRIGPEHLERLFALRQADIDGSGLPKRDDADARFEARVRDELAREHPLCVRDLHLGGAQVIAAMIIRGMVPTGYRGDARVRRALEWLLEQVTEVPECNDATTLQALLERYLDETTASHGSVASSSLGE